MTFDIIAYIRQAIEDAGIKCPYSGSEKIYVSKKHWFMLQDEYEKRTGIKHTSLTFNNISVRIKT